MNPNENGGAPNADPDAELGENDPTTHDSHVPFLWDMSDILATNPEIKDRIINSVLAKHDADVSDALERMTTAADEFPRLAKGLRKIAKLVEDTVPDRIVAGNYAIQHLHEAAYWLKFIGKNAKIGIDDHSKHAHQTPNLGKVFDDLFGKVESVELSEDGTPESRDLSEEVSS